MNIDVADEDAAMRRAADLLGEHFDSVIILCSAVRQGCTIPFTYLGGNAFANETILLNAAEKFESRMVPVSDDEADGGNDTETATP